MMALLTDFTVSSNAQLGSLKHLKGVGLPTEILRDLYN